jgi:hypothetical protein
MSLFVNLSTTHDYSINETVSAFVKLCNEHSQGCLQRMPRFFQNGTNYAWVMAQYKLNYKSLIEPYKLGNITTEQFLHNLTEIFYFMKDIDAGYRNALLIDAWNASIKMSEFTQDRLSRLVEKAESEPVFLIANTNELNVKAVLDLFKQKYPNLQFNNGFDVSIKESKEPIEILPNIFLCLSYRYKSFKAENVTTGSILEELVQQNNSENITVVSQFDGDLQKAKQLGIADVQTAEKFYGPEITLSLTEKNQ